MLQLLLLILRLGCFFIPVHIDFVTLNDAVVWRKILHPALEVIMFFNFRQNNSHGKFEITEVAGHEIVIEADSVDDANDRASNVIEFDVGCPCCGDRWNRVWDTKDGTELPTAHYGADAFNAFPDTLDPFDFPMLCDTYIVDVYYKDKGLAHKRIVYDILKLRKQAKDRQRDAGNKLWGVCFNTFGVSPVFEAVENTRIGGWWDDSGNRKIEGVGLHIAEAYAFGSFGTTDKKEAQKFVREYKDARKFMQMQVRTYAENAAGSVAAKAYSTLITKDV